MILEMSSSEFQVHCRPFNVYAYGAHAQCTCIWICYT